MPSKLYLDDFRRLNEVIAHLPNGDLRAGLTALSDEIRGKLCELYGAKKTTYKKKVLDDLFLKVKEYE